MAKWDTEGLPKVTNTASFFLYCSEGNPNWLFQFLTPLAIFPILGKISQPFKFVHNSCQKLITIVFKNKRVDRIYLWFPAPSLFNSFLLSGDECFIFFLSTVSTEISKISQTSFSHHSTLILPRNKRSKS